MFQFLCNSTDLKVADGVDTRLMPSGEAVPHKRARVDRIVNMPVPKTNQLLLWSSSTADICPHSQSIRPRSPWQTYGAAGDAESNLAHLRARIQESRSGCPGPTVPAIHEKSQWASSSDRNMHRSLVIPFRRPTADWADITSAAVIDLKAIFKPGLDYAKAVVMLLDID